ncbi:MAG: tetratricopeptide repeat protein [Cyanobacteriota bacterium]|nr:tetratricopeptide repeat protein [Cyanobacteriota bacterium]
MVSAPSAQAITPYVYVPSSEELKRSALGIGRTAAQLLQLGQPEQSAKLAALAVRLDPQDERLWSILAEAQLRSDDLEQASQSLARAKELNPDKAGLWFAQGALALRDERPEEAVPLIQRGLELDPKNPAAYFDLGNARIMTNDLSSALGSFEQATTLKPDFWEALNNQALVLYEMGNADEAIRRWRAVLKIEENAEPLLALAAALHQQGDDSEVPFNMAREALNKEPNYVLPPHQTEQLWGIRIRQAAAELLASPQLSSSVERAQANATWKKRQ